ncbi:MAG: molybdenum cofactor biosynthesis protein MoaE, partial [Gallionellaceae bacterium]|nr:molybdenum cofactor biosynthesis protein MoaE [Gallionellaceae bacterium]
MNISIQQHDFDVSTELNALRASNKNVGALVSFVGLVRDFNGDDPIENLTLEHYPGMSEKA